MKKIIIFMILPILRKRENHMTKTQLRKYARLIARAGGNIRKGQEVILSAQLDQPEFVTMLVEECYRAGASKVTVDWAHQPISKLHIRHRSLKTLSTIEEWELKKLERRTEVLPVAIYLESSDPDGMKGVDQKKQAKAAIATYPITKPYRDKMDNRYQWCIAAVPGKKWAKKVFPGIPASTAVKKLWDAILYTSRAAEGDPIENWKCHNENLKQKYDYLNSLGIEKLHYTASNGTDFTVGLNKQGIFMGGGENTLSGVFYNPNIPSEEIFTSPMKGEAEGIVYASKPLSYKGELIENFSVRFEGGKAVEVHAEKGEELLKEMISMDEGATYLGEVALVPFDSPINQTGILFYNTLFDENACCHLALGAGFTNCIKDFDKYTTEQLHEMGVNDSMIHVDFMIGTADLSIEALCSDGKTVQIFKDGNWAI